MTTLADALREAGIQGKPTSPPRSIKRERAQRAWLQARRDARASYGMVASEKRRGGVAKPVREARFAGLKR